MQINKILIECRVNNVLKKTKQKASNCSITSSIKSLVYMFFFLLVFAKAYESCKTKLDVRTL